MFGKNWAMPVTSKPWALVASVLEVIKVRSRYKVAVHAAHRAWERATAPPDGWEYAEVVDGTCACNGIFTLRRP